MKHHAHCKEDNSKFVWGLLVGSAVGIAIGGLIMYATHKEDSILDEIQHATKEAKKKVTNAVNEGLEELEDISHKISKSAKETLKHVNG